jgi:hypothetical protein
MLLLSGLLLSGLLLALDVFRERGKLRDGQVERRCDLLDRGPGWVALAPLDQPERTGGEPGPVGCLFLARGLRFAPAADSQGERLIG